jgi:2-keto-4-pentenoate hydratase/2-oxohepta-3-ene-1,7-dioic acid hydratase in catechol pathway
MLDEGRLLAPLPSDRTRIFALGGNFAKHLLDANSAIHGAARASELLAQRRAVGPWGFHILPETVVGPGATISPPAGIGKLDYEGEVAVILASGGRDLVVDDVAIWGFTGWNDFSLRDTLFKLGEPYDRGSMSWTLQKNFDSGSSAGPWVAVDGQPELGALPISLRVNGELRQSGSTSEMIFSFAETASHLSRFLTLRAGDVIVSGTPSGTALESGVDGPFLGPADELELEVGGLGILRNRVAEG